MKGRKGKLSAIQIMLPVLGCFFLFISDARTTRSQVSELFAESNWDVGHSVQQTSDDGYIIAGYTWTPNNSRDVYLIKTDPEGKEQWNTTFGETSNDAAYSVQQTSDDGYIIVGYTYSYGKGLSDVYLIKTDPEGKEQWNTTFGGVFNDVGHSVQQTKDGGYIIAGYTWSMSDDCDAYLIKANPEGKEQWSKIFGGSSDDRVYSVQQTEDGGYIIAGSTMSFGEGENDVFVIKTDSGGNQEWNTTFGGPYYDRAYSVRQTEDGGYVITGSTMSFGEGENDVFIIKTDSGGNEKCNTTFGGSCDDRAYSVRQTEDGMYVIAGSTKSFSSKRMDVYIIKTGSEGILSWNKTIGGGLSSDAGRSVQQTSDGGYIITGWTNSFDAIGKDVYLIKTGSRGNWEWSRTFGGTFDDEGSSENMKLGSTLGQ